MLELVLDWSERPELSASALRTVDERELAQRQSLATPLRKHGLPWLVPLRGEYDTEWAHKRPV